MSLKERFSSTKKNPPSFTQSPPVSRSLGYLKPPPQISYAERYKSVLIESDEEKSIQQLIKENDNLRQCLRDMNAQITKKVDREKDNIFLKNRSSQGLKKKTKDEEIESQLNLLEREQHNNNFIISQQEREIKQLDEKMDSMAGNQQYTLVGQIEVLMTQIRQEQMEIKQSKLMNFREGKYLDNALGNDQGKPKVVEEQQTKMMEVMKMQQSNDKLKETVKKRDELMIEYAKKISMIDEDYQKALRRERSVVEIDVVLQGAIQEQKKKTDAQEDNLEIVAKNQEREMARIQNVINELKLIEKQTDDSINEKEMQIRQLNVDLEQLRGLAKEANPNALKQLEQHNEDIFDNNQLHQDVQAAIESSKVLNKQKEVIGKVEVSRRHQSKDVLEKGGHNLNGRSRQNLSHPKNGSQVGEKNQKEQLNRLPSLQQFSEVKPTLIQNKGSEEFSNSKISNGELKSDEEDLKNQKNQDISPVVQKKQAIVSQKQQEQKQQQQTVERQNSRSSSYSSQLNEGKVEEIKKVKGNDQQQMIGSNKIIKKEPELFKGLQLVEQPIKKQNPVKITSDAQTEMTQDQPQKIIYPSKNRTTIQVNDTAKDKSNSQSEDVFAMTKLPASEQNGLDNKLASKPTKIAQQSQSENKDKTGNKKPLDVFEEIE